MDDKVNDLIEKDLAAARVRTEAILPPGEIDEDRPQFWPSSRHPNEMEEIPWFLHSFVNPPTNPLTIRLLALVEDLPSIPGPLTVGPENYSRIFDAFMKSGWAGFEEEFDRIVSRDRADYTDVKRDLLREPIFSIKAHRNMADAALGRKAVDEIFDEMARQQEQKPQ